MPQDNFNPVVSPLWNSLKNLSSDTSIELMSIGLIDSLMLLLKSSHIVSSLGTFPSSISILSTQLKTFISFRDHSGLHGHLSDVLSAKGVSSVRIFDKEMRYTPVGSWSNLECQVSLMLKYPASFLDIEKAF